MTDKTGSLGTRTRPRRATHPRHTTQARAHATRHSKSAIAHARPCGLAGGAFDTRRPLRTVNARERDTHDPAARAVKAHARGGRFPHHPRWRRRRKATSQQGGGSSVHSRDCSPCSDAEAHRTPRTGTAVMRAQALRPGGNHDRLCATRGATTYPTVRPHAHRSHARHRDGWPRHAHAPLRKCSQERRLPKG
jgi:hypothetical protein